MITNVSDFGASWGRLMVRFRWAVIVASLLMVASSGYGLRYLSFSNSYTSLFDSENPELLAFINLQQVYGPLDNFLITVRREDGEKFKPKDIAVVEALTEDSWGLPHVQRVDSLTNFQYTWADQDDLTVEDLIQDAAMLNQAELDERIQVALDEPQLAGRIISLDGRATGINMVNRLPPTLPNSPIEAAEAAFHLLDDYKSAHPELVFGAVGVNPINQALNSLSRSDMFTLFPQMFFILGLLVYLALRNIRLTLAVGSIVVGAVIAGMGLGFYTGIQLRTVSTAAPIIIATLAVAESIHIVWLARRSRLKCQSQTDAIAYSLASNFWPVTVTSITTVIGFLALNFSLAPPIVDLGNITAMGLSIAWVLSLTLLPALLSFIPLEISQGNQSIQTILEKIGVFVCQYARWIVASLSVICLMIVASLPSIEFDDRLVHLFDQKTTIRQDSESAMQYLTGVYPLEFDMSSGTPAGINSPQFLAKVEKFSNWLRSQPEVRHVYSYTDTAKRLNRNMHGDDPDWYRLPDNRELAAQYLLLYELSLPYGLDLTDRIDIDKSSTRVTATMTDVSAQQIQSLLSRSYSWAQSNLSEGESLGASSPPVMFAFVTQRIIAAMMQGNLYAILAITLVLSVALGSVKFGLLSIVPNVLPVMVALGIWTLTVGQLGYGGAAVSALALGIVVDDTVHFLMKYLRAKSNSYTPREAVKYAINTVGGPIIVTTSVLGIGFAFLMTSLFINNVHLGQLTAITIIVACALDLLLLPALLVLFDKTSEGIGTDQLHA